MEGNPIRTIRRSLLTQSTDDLKKYLRTRGDPPQSAHTHSHTHTANTTATAGGAVAYETEDRVRSMTGGTLNFSGLNLVITCNTISFALLFF